MVGVIGIFVLLTAACASNVLPQPEIRDPIAANPNENTNFHSALRKKADDALLATLATDLERRFQTNIEKDDNSKKELRQMQTCTRNSLGTNQLANCILPLLKKHLNVGAEVPNVAEVRQKRQNPFDVFKADFQNEIRVETDLASAMRDRPIDQKSIMPQSSASIATYLTGILRDFKSKTGPWRPDLSKMRIGGDRFDGKSINRFDQKSISDSKLANLTNAIRESLLNLMKAPMFLLKGETRNAIDSKADEGPKRSKRQNSDDRLRFLSPRLFPLFDDSSPRMLSPDFFSFYDSQNSVASLPALFKKFETPLEKKAWLEFVGELSGASDYLRWMQTDEFKRLVQLYQEQQQHSQLGNDQSNQQSIIKSIIDNRFLFDQPQWEGVQKSLVASTQEEASTIKETSAKIFEPLSNIGNVGEFLLSLSPDQWQQINQRGYAFMNQFQLNNVYGRELVNDKSYWPFDMSAYIDWTDDQRSINVIPPMVSSIIDNHESSSENRTKRQTAEPPPPTFVPPTILAPSVGPAFVNQIFLQSPTILSPAVFTPIINGPLVLSPYILSPYVFSPFIIAPQVLTPFILNPFVLSPDILEPFVLSPAILSPTVLSPFILDPYVLSPPILSPSVGSPNILSPFVLSPTILSPSTLTATILSPGVLSPSILSDSDGPTILSPCVLCRKRRRRRK